MSEALKVEPIAPAPTVPRAFQFRLWHLLVAMGLISVALAVIAPVYRSLRVRGLEEESSNNLRQIALALHNYHSAWRAFPPAHQCDASGKPVHSWRVLIMPYIQEQGHFNGYNFAESWNGPNNSKLAKPMPSVFRSPFVRPGSTVSTNYVAVVGPNTAWPGQQSMTMDGIPDGLSLTILVVEIGHSDIHWMEPRDLPIEDFEAWLDPTHKPRLGGDVGGIAIAMADGSVKVVTRKVDIELWRRHLAPGDHTAHLFGN